MKYIAIFVLLSVTMLSCSSSEPVINEQNTESPTSTVKEIPKENLNRSVSSLDATRFRSELSDTYANKTNEIPAGFQRLKVEDEEETDLFEGYRVQIFSGQNVALADTVASMFRTWSDTTIVGYQAETYTFFKAPYYRVHVGDFHDKELAIYYSNLLKRRFKDSWVVYDRVNPYNVPADTTYIYTVD
jgi:hypothetical protein